MRFVTPVLQLMDHPNQVPFVRLTSSVLYGRVLGGVQWGFLQWLLVYLRMSFSNTSRQIS